MPSTSVAISGERQRRQSRDALARNEVEIVTQGSMGKAKPAIVYLGRRMARGGGPKSRTQIVPLSN